jgi:hypothetical protein
MAYWSRFDIGGRDGSDKGVFVVKLVKDEEVTPGILTEVDATATGTSV